MTRNKKNRVIQQQPDRRANRTILVRTLFLLLVFGILAFIPLFLKLYDIQITNNKYYLERAIDQQTRDSEVSANRGTIYDSTGTPLAMSYTAYNIQLSPRDIAELQISYQEAVEKGKTPEYPAPSSELISQGLAEILDLDADGIAERLTKTWSQYEVIKWRVEDDEANAVREFISTNHLSSGIYVMPTTKRLYPKGSLASQVIGWVNFKNDGKGAYGMEAVYEDQLAGATGRVVTAKNGSGTEMLYRFEDYYDATDGNDLTLTIDATIQSYCERILEKGIEMFEVQNGGFCIVMDPKTGAILAWANSPTYDLNDPWAVTDPILSAYLEQVQNDPDAKESAYTEALQQVQNQQWRNKAINDTYEPGSTFKTVVLAAALEEGVVTESDHFYCSGSVMFDFLTQPIRCSNRNGHKDQDLATAVGNSCNPAFIAIGQRLGAEKFYDYLEAFGFLDPTGIDILGESKINPVSAGLIWSRDFFTSTTGQASLATASFGQTFQITPIQLITAASAVVNGGYLMQPYVVSKIVDPDGNVVQQKEPTVVRQVISEQTSERCRNILEKVVDGGTGHNAQVEGYRIGGKTGSSETLEKDHTIVSFLGFAPVDDPQMIVLLAYDNPKPSAPGSNYTAGDWYISGGIMAATMAGELIEDILDHMGVEKAYTAQADTLVPSVVGLGLTDATARLNDANLSLRTVGDGDTVTGQIPIANASIPGGSEVVLYMGTDVPTDQVEVPDVRGKTAEAARQILANVGLYMKAAGATDYGSSTVASSQSINPGTMVDRGTTVEVHFIDNTGEGHDAGL